MGRNKIDIKYITEPRKRQVTLNKRKGGLMKKAYELSILCGCEISVLIKDQRGQSYVYSSADADECFKTYLKDEESPTENLDNRAMRHRLEDSDTEDEDEDIKPTPVHSRARKLVKPKMGARQVTKRATGTGGAGKGKGKGKGKGGGISSKAKAAATKSTSSSSQPSHALHRKIKPYDPDDYELDPLPDHPTKRSASMTTRRRSQTTADTTLDTTSTSTTSAPSSSFEPTTTTVPVSTSTVTLPMTTTMAPKTISSDETTNEKHYDSETEPTSMSDIEEEADIETDGADSHPDSTPTTLPEVGWRSMRKRRPSLKVLTGIGGKMPLGIVKRPSEVMASDALSPSVTPFGNIELKGSFPTTKNVPIRRRSSVPSDALNPILNSPSFAMIGDVATPVSATIAGGFVTNDPNQFWNPWN